MLKECDGWNVTVLVFGSTAKRDVLYSRLLDLTPNSTEQYIIMIYGLCHTYFDCKGSGFKENIRRALSEELCPAW